MRRITPGAPSPVGSQLAWSSGPGGSRCRYSSSDPSGL
ncbi:Uncharacterised protein [Bordetella pertussis]|nr:Uncharacterised protein [Bordetella pertussis]